MKVPKINKKAGVAIIILILICIYFGLVHYLNSVEKNLVLGNSLHNTERLRDDLETQLELLNLDITSLGMINDTTASYYFLVTAIKNEIENYTKLVEWVSSRELLSNDQIDSVKLMDKETSKRVKIQHILHAENQNKLNNSLRQLLIERDALLTKITQEKKKLQSMLLDTKKLLAESQELNANNAEGFLSEIKALQDQITEKEEQQKAREEEVSKQISEITDAYEKLKASQELLVIEAFYLYPIRRKRETPIRLDANGMESDVFKKFKAAETPKIEFRVGFRIIDLNELPENLRLSIKRISESDSISILSEYPVKIDKDVMLGTHSARLEPIIPLRNLVPGKYLIELFDSQPKSVLLRDETFFYIKEN